MNTINNNLVFITQDKITYYKDAFRISNRNHENILLSIFHDLLATNIRLTLKKKLL